MFTVNKIKKTGSKDNTNYLIIKANKTAFKPEVINSSKYHKNTQKILPRTKEIENIFEIY